MKSHIYKSLQLILGILFITSTVSCKKESNNSNNSGPFVITYEVTATEKVLASFGSPIITYVNEFNQVQNEAVTSISSSFTWSKKITANSTTRPYNLKLLISASNPSYYIILPKKGSITQKIFINDELKASSTSNSESIATGTGSTFRINTLPIEFIVQ